jgi:hypothetical protein
MAYAPQISGTIFVVIIRTYANVNGVEHSSWGAIFSVVTVSFTDIIVSVLAEHKGTISTLIIISAINDDLQGDPIGIQGQLFSTGQPAAGELRVLQPPRR